MQYFVIYLIIYFNYCDNMKESHSTSIGLCLETRVVLISVIATEGHWLI